MNKYIEKVKHLLGYYYTYTAWWMQIEDLRKTVWCLLNYQYHFQVHYNSKIMI
jgi:hypothetical protein